MRRYDVVIVVALAGSALSGSSACRIGGASPVGYGGPGGNALISPTSTASTSAHVGQFSFPAPPPKASGTIILTSVGGATLDGVAGELAKYLKRAKYEQLGWYYYPEGFVVATRLEQIEATGKPKQPASKRWSPAFPEPDKWWERVLATIHIAPGRFRVFAFIVTKDLGGVSPPVERETAEAWSSGGLKMFPSDLKGKPFTADHHVHGYAYVYEQANADETPELVDGLSVHDHLVAAGLGHFVGE
ncbi:MAG: hypothetical protein HYV09_19280 [Deltaproteobacteria bacterium]|nr:hypothetical protein [Deltaproteobacteria bacterium]